MSSRPPHILPPPADSDNDDDSNNQRSNNGPTPTSPTDDEDVAYDMEVIAASRLATAQSQQRSTGRRRATTSAGATDDDNTGGNQDDSNNTANGEASEVSSPLFPRQDSNTDEGSTPDASSLAAPAAKSSNASGKPKKRKKPRKVLFNLSLSKYAVIRELANEFGFVIDDDEEVERFDFNFLWSDTILPLQKLVRVANWQKVNHFPSMHLLCRKVHLGITINRMRKQFPTHFTFAPMTWSLRSERSQFHKYLSQHAGRKTFICKPNAGCQGKGIILTKDPLGTVEDLDNYIVQEYITKPLLIENKKFDLRVYVLVTCVRHPSVFVYHDGLVRMCAEDYEKPSDDNMTLGCMHLTNYAVNKHSEQFVFNSDGERGDVGNKRDFRFFNSWLDDNGHDSRTVWDRIHHMIGKTIIAAQPQLAHVYNSCFPHHNDGYSCFELLGFDIMMDEKLKPWLLEVNHTPSFQCDTPLDHRIKHGVLSEVWKIVNINGEDKFRHLQKERKEFAARLNQRKLPPGAQASSSSVQQQQAQPSQSGSGVGESDVDWREVMRAEDSRLTNFTRVVPSPKAERQALYEDMMRAGKDLTATATTASQEQREKDAKAERERRDNEKAKKDALDCGKGASAAAASAGALATSSSAAKIPTSSSSGVGEPSASTSRAHKPHCSSDDVSPSAGPRPPKDAGGNGGGGGSSSSSSASALHAKEKNASAMNRGTDQLQRLRDRLGEQMEKHRRRMIMGPRLSVFQLREAQLDALATDDEGQQQQHQQQQQGLQHSASAGALPPMPRSEYYFHDRRGAAAAEGEGGGRRGAEEADGSASLAAHHQRHQSQPTQQQQRHQPTYANLVAPPPPPLTQEIPSSQQQQVAYSYLVPAATSSSTATGGGGGTGGRQAFPAQPSPGNARQPTIMHPLEPTEVYPYQAPPQQRRSSSTTQHQSEVRPPNPSTQQRHHNGGGGGTNKHGGGSAHQQRHTSSSTASHQHQHQGPTYAASLPSGSCREGGQFMWYDPKSDRAHLGE